MPASVTYASCLLTGCDPGVPARTVTYEYYTTKTIIEVTGGRGRRKVGQVQKLLTNSLLNPEGKQVIVFGPNLKPGTAKAIEELGVKVVRTLDELQEAVKLAPE